MREKLRNANLVTTYRYIHVHVHVLCTSVHMYLRTCSPELHKYNRSKVWSTHETSDCDLQKLLQHHMYIMVHTLQAKSGSLFAVHTYIHVVKDHVIEH